MTTESSKKEPPVSPFEELMERLLRNMTATEIATVPLQTPGPNSILLNGAGVFVDSHLRRLLALIEVVKKAPAVLEQMLEKETKEKFPSLAGPFVPYQGWRVGSEKPQEDLFRPVGLVEMATKRDPVSTRSDSIMLGPILGASVTN